MIKSPLLTDLYELTMAAAYFNEGIEAEATFSLYTRRHAARGYFVAAGLNDALAYLEHLQFDTEEIDYLRRTGRFEDDFLHHLADLRFTGRVRALPEGTLFFADEPIMEITAPVIQAQIIETWLINTVGLATMLATKAARCVHAARGRGLIDFSLRRTQGSSAGLAMARSSYLAGFDGTSNVLAGKMFDIPVSGTMAHSFVLAFEEELEAFRAYARRFPQQTILLIDTYDTIAGAHKAVQIAQEMREQGNRLIGVRLDSGDLNALSRQVRTILDSGQCPDVKIFASGGFDEYTIARSIDQQSAIDAFGVGTKAGVSADAPYLDMVYKMVRFNDQPKRKLSPGKITLAGEKQIFRRKDPHGRYAQDIIALSTEKIEAADPLLQTVMQAGRRTANPADLEELRRAFQDNFQHLPDAYKALEQAPPFPVRVSDRLQDLNKK